MTTKELIPIFKEEMGERYDSSFAEMIAFRIEAKSKEEAEERYEMANKYVSHQAFSTDFQQILQIISRGLKIAAFGKEER